MKNKITEMQIQQLPSGNIQSIVSYTFTGNSGPKIYIQANIHGPEIAGCPVVNELIKFLENQPTINGTVVLVPSANPVGLNTKIGGLPIGYINHNGKTSHNWNRIFLDLLSRNFDLNKFIKKNALLPKTKILSLYKKHLIKEIITMEKETQYGLSIEKKLAITLQKLSVDADYLIDLHSAGYNQPHIYTFMNSIKSAKFFAIKYILQLPIEFTGAFDEAFYLPWKKLADGLKQMGKEQFFNREAFTVELENDNEISSAKTKKYVRMILNYLKSKGVIQGKPELSHNTFWICESKDYVKYFAPQGGLVEPLVVVGQKIKKGQPLVKISVLASASMTKEVTLYAQDDCVVNSFPLSRVVAEGEPVIGILKNLRKIKL